MQISDKNFTSDKKQDHREREFQNTTHEENLKSIILHVALVFTVTTLLDLYVHILLMMHGLPYITLLTLALLTNICIIWVISNIIQKLFDNQWSFAELLPKSFIYISLVIKLAIQATAYYIYSSSNHKTIKDTI